MKITRFEDLECWQEAKVLVNTVYKATQGQEFIQFLFIAMSSAAEVQSHLYVALDQHYINQDSFDSIYSQAEKTARIISGLIKYLRTSPNHPTAPNERE